MLQKNLGGGCRSVGEVLQRGVLKNFGGSSWHASQRLYEGEIFVYIDFSALPVSRMLLGFGFSGYPGRD